MGRGCDDWDDDSYVEALPGHVSAADGADGPTDAEALLLDMITDITRLEVLLREASPDEFEKARARLDLFQKRVIELPRAAVKPAPPERRIGFQVQPRTFPSPKRRKKKR